MGRVRGGVVNQAEKTLAGCEHLPDDVCDDCICEFRQLLVVLYETDPAILAALEGLPEAWARAIDDPPLALIGAMIRCSYGAGYSTALSSMAA